MLTDFQNYFADRLTGKFATNSHLNMTPYLKYVATLLCEIWMSENWRSFKYINWSMINHGGFSLQIYHSVCWWKKLKIREHLAKLQAQWLIVSYAPFALDFCPQRCRTRQISKITRIWREETVTNCCYVHRQINVSLLSTNIKLL